VRAIKDLRARLVNTNLRELAGRGRNVFDD